METDVVVIGGGATGCGVAWDLTLRGLHVTLVEMGDVGTGTSGRYHGLLHTGSRYVTSDLTSAKECWQEHNTIRRVVPQAVDDTGGLFVLSPSDDEAFVEKWVEGCEAAGISANELEPSEALRREPLVHPKIRRAFEVPDASCDSLALCAALRESAESGGANSQCHDVYSAERARKSNNAQLLTMGGRVIAPEAAKTVLDAWLASEFAGGGSTRKVEKMEEVDRRYHQVEQS